MPPTTQSSERLAERRRQAAGTRAPELRRRQADRELRARPPGVDARIVALLAIVIPLSSLVVRWYRRNGRPPR